jgi:imidazolonepropionase-like amidohydrolase
MRYLYIAAAALLSCGPAQSPKSPDDKKAALPADAEWSDPETHLVALPDKRGSLADAVKNPKAPVIAITGGTVMTAAGKRYAPGMVVLEGGAIKSVGPAGPTPSGAQVIDAAGRFVTPGIIDTHSHIGVYAAPFVSAHSDGNEMVGATTPYARAEYGYWPNDPAITRARAGGVTTALILPGSANLIGGRGFTAIMRPGTQIDHVAFPGAPQTLKMACGENPKRVYGDKGGPQTRMAEYAKFREAYRAAVDYRAKRKRYAEARAKWEKRRDQAAAKNAELDKAKADERVAAEPAPEPVPVDLGLETLAAVLDGEVLVQVHCYRSDELRHMVAIAGELGFKIRSFHHALEAYKVRDLLIKNDVAISTWADWWGFKMEAFDGIPENAALFHASGGRAVIHSDSSIGIQRLNQEAAKAMHAGRRAGLEISDDDALRWVTANPAWVLGVHEMTGTLENGKRADVVVWNTTPLSVYSLADVVLQGGEVVYQRKAGKRPTDFELGNSSVDDNQEKTRATR